MYIGISRMESPLPTPVSKRQMNSVAKLVLKMLASSAPKIEHPHANNAVDFRPYVSAKYPPTSMELASLSVAVALIISSWDADRLRSSRMYCNGAARL